VERSELWIILTPAQSILMTKKWHYSLVIDWNFMMSDTNPPKEKDKAEDPSRRPPTDQLPPPVTLAEPSSRASPNGFVIPATLPK